MIALPITICVAVLFLGQVALISRIEKLEETNRWLRTKPWEADEE